ncbi:MAG: OmpA family protein [Bacteroidota bacterium]|nr:OmpA family protein [Candidatus Kapabacteria bacterium]MCS7303384.1 OmpA family protein [Candidatus Kapabacteria bacterium]MDW8075924.1 OmpA family protein [Bacteroidota bacterium]MDW8272540.1 OmpA family protein [Bacteroidota bacterium]
MKRYALAAFVWVAVFSLGGGSSGCRSYRDPEAQLAIARFDTTDQPSSRAFFRGTLPIDSVRDISTLRFDIWKIESDDYPKEIRLMARVFDSSGNFITHLAPPVVPTQERWIKLTETLGRRTVPIGTFSVREYGEGDSAMGYRIVLALDYSGSMRGVLDAMHEGAQLFIRMKYPADELAIATFNTQLDVKVPFTHDRAALSQQYMRTYQRNFGGYSSVYDGLIAATMLFDTATDERPRVLVCFTDGDENASREDARALFEHAQRRRVRIFPIGFGYVRDELLEYIAQQTGGRFYRVTSRKELLAAFEEIYRSLRYYYLVRYTPPVFAGLHHVELSLQPRAGSQVLIARGSYDKSDINPWAQLNDAFNKMINFDYNKATLRPDAIPIIEEIVDQLERYERVWLEVRGHTDDIGGIEFNQRLSEARARAVVQALVERGIDSVRLRARGMGMLYPLVPNTSEENRAKNRRTEFVIIRR